MYESSTAKRVADVDFDIVDETSAQSFPASDPPAWATGQVYGAAAGEKGLNTSTRDSSPPDAHPARPRRRVASATRETAKR